ncbi:MAG: 23S rRNA (guanine(745)-N(1))-methyltransferase [Gammaproteobacteria bacterium]|nr:23S rRNA (guanine(745)-N(1))-methyltransferase [Gammaproteobacteria bacterium]MCF6230304.1 23S rRNA (guanine(745)-N(1))-methyltransferase [Gammaproteobacteria bacterium]
MKSIYKCPVCSETLELLQRSWRCANNHHFDMAREGYVNLLLAHQKKSKQTGDNKMMIQSRRHFLNNHYYDILPEKLSALLSVHFSSKLFSLLDIGCGEGYYSDFIQNNLPECQVWGVDISKPAIIAAAKRYPNISFSAASSYRLPINDQAVDVVTKIYAPAENDEIFRVLKPNGLYFSVTPGKSHLFGLKKLIYDTPKEHDEAESVPAGFEWLDRSVLCDAIKIENNQDIANLLAMTPYFWQLSKSRHQEIAALSTLNTEISFIINIYRKN